MMGSFVGSGLLIGIGLIAAPATIAKDAIMPTLTFAFEEDVRLAREVKVGATPYGERTIVPITGGRFAGPGLKGEILPGGWDWQLKRADGCVELRADYMLRTDDGVVINVVNRGVSCPSHPDLPLRTQAVFEAPLGRYAWLGQAAFIGTIEPAGAKEGEPVIRIRFYRVT